jgi:predicted MarR family transcription regulator
VSATLDGRIGPVAASMRSVPSIARIGNKHRQPAVSTLSEFEFGPIVVDNAFGRWTVRCMSAAGHGDADMVQETARAALAVGAVRPGGARGDVAVMFAWREWKINGR